MGLDPVPGCTSTKRNAWPSATVLYSKSSTKAKAASLSRCRFFLCEAPGSGVFANARSSLWKSCSAYSPASRVKLPKPHSNLGSVLAGSSSSSVSKLSSSRGDRLTGMVRRWNPGPALHFLHSGKHGADEKFDVLPRKCISSARTPARKSTNVALPQVAQLRAALFCSQMCSCWMASCRHVRSTRTALGSLLRWTMMEAMDSEASVFSQCREHQLISRSLGMAKKERRCPSTCRRQHRLCASCKIADTPPLGRRACACRKRKVKACS